MSFLQKDQLKLWQLNDRSYTIICDPVPEKLGGGKDEANAQLELQPYPALLQLRKLLREIVVLANLEACLVGCGTRGRTR